MDNPVKEKDLEMDVGGFEIVPVIESAEYD